jgi:Fe-S cluster assembly ATPase SufC
MANNQLALNIAAKTDSVTEVAVTRAETLLRAVKAKYIIQLPDGSVISQGGLELVTPNLLSANGVILLFHTVHTHR